MEFILMALAVWYGVWEGLMEPSLPLHSYQTEDALQFGFGLLCGIGSYVFYTRANPDDASQVKARIQTAGLTALVLLTFGLSFFFWFPTLTNYDRIAFPYYEITFDLIGIPAPNEKGTLREWLVYLTFFVPFVVSIVKSMVLSACSLLVLQGVVHGKTPGLVCTEEIFQGAFWLSGAFHLLIAVFYFVAF